MKSFFVRYLILGFALCVSSTSASLAQSAALTPEANSGQCSFSYASLDKPGCQTLSIDILNERINAQQNREFTGRTGGGTTATSSNPGVSRNLGLKPREGPICECVP